MSIDPLRYLFTDPGIGCISDCFTVGFWLIKRHGRTSGEDRGE